MDEPTPICKICCEVIRGFTPCRNGCCLACHAAYCDPQGDVLDLAQARARLRADVRETTPGVDVDEPSF